MTPTSATKRREARASRNDTVRAVAAWLYVPCVLLGRADRKHRPTGIWRFDSQDWRLFSDRHFIGGQNHDGDVEDVCSRHVYGFNLISSAAAYHTIAMMVVRHRSHCLFFFAFARFLCLLQASQQGQSGTNANESSPSQCKLYIADSTIPNAGLGIFTAIPLQEDDLIGHGDVIFPLIDFDYHQGENDYFNPFTEYVWASHVFGMQYEADDKDSVLAYAPGLNCAINCNLALVNVEGGDFDYDDGVGGHRSVSPSAGSMTPYHNGQTYATMDIPAGGELFKYYGDSWFVTRETTFGLIPLYDDYLEAERLLKEWNELQEKHNLESSTREDLYQFLTQWPKETRTSYAFPSTYQQARVVMETSMRDLHQPNATRSIEELQSQGRCLDNIMARPSILPYAGRGAFAVHPLKEGSIVTGTPVLHLPSCDLAKVYNEVEDEYTRESFVGYALWYNYCISHHKTSALLCPYGSGINYINHNQTLVNVKMQWAPDGSMSQDASWLNRPPQDANHVYMTHLAIDYVATRDIAEGEELFLDYGDDWERAWQQHVQEWPFDEEQDYISATQWNKENAHESIRTIDEQVEHPYPENLMMRCASDVYFDDSEEWKDGEKTMVWHYVDKGHECQVWNRTMNDDNGEEYYTVEILDEDSFDRPWNAGDYNPDMRKIRHGVPRDFISMIDAPYTTDLHMSKAFRHFISMPNDMLPETWINQEEGE